MIGLKGFKRLVLITGVIACLAFSVADVRPFMAALAVGAAIASALLSKPLPRLALNIMVLAAALNAAVSVLGNRTELISHLTVFLCLILMIKFFDREKMRDEAQILGLSIFIVIGSVLTGQSFLLGLLILAHTPMVITGVVLFQVYAGRERWQRRARDAHAELTSATLPGRFGRQLAGVITLGVALSVAMAVLAFVVTPRGIVQRFMGELGRVPGGASVGYRENIRLGEGGYINQNASPVMDLILKDEQGQVITDRVEPVYLRGSVLTYYLRREREWVAYPDPRMQLESETESAVASRFRRRRDPMNASIARQLGLEPLAVPSSGLMGDVAAGRTRIVQEISTRSSQGTTAPLFAAWRPVKFTINAAPGVDSPKPLYIPRDGLILRSGGSGRISYRVESVTDYRADIPEEPMLDRSVFSGASFRTLAGRLAEQSGFPTNPDAEFEAGELRRLCNTLTQYFRREYQYTLENPAPDDSEDPVEMFLFRTKRGHCEYFAAGMVALLQSLGVESRIVTGYVATEFNPIAGHYTIRQSDAHAWVEVRMSAERWETFDPTPPAELQSAQRSRSGLWAKVRQAWEALEFGWIDNVVSYDRGVQLELFGSGGGRSQDAPLLQLRQSINRFVSSLTSWWPKEIGGEVGGLAVLGLALGLGAVWALRNAVRLRLWLASVRNRLLGSKVDAQQQSPEGRLYARALALLDRAGVGKPPTRTPLNHALAIEPQSPALAALVRRAAGIYYAARFGAKPASDATQAELAGELDELERTVAAAPKGVR